MQPGKLRLGFPFLGPAFSTWSQDRPPAVLSRVAHTVALRGRFSLSRKEREWERVGCCRGGEVGGTACLHEQIDFFCILPTASPGGIRSARTRPRRWLRSFSVPAVGSSSTWGRPSHLAALSSMPSGIPVARLDSQSLWSSHGAC